MTKLFSILILLGMVGCTVHNQPAQPKCVSTTVPDLWTPLHNKEFNETLNMADDLIALHNPKVDKIVQAHLITLKGIIQEEYDQSKKEEAQASQAH